MQGLLLTCTILPSAIVELVLDYEGFKLLKSLLGPTLQSLCRYAKNNEISITYLQQTWQVGKNHNEHCEQAVGLVQLIRVQSRQGAIINIPILKDGKLKRFFHASLAFGCPSLPRWSQNIFEGQNISNKKSSTKEITSCASGQKNFVMIKKVIKMVCVLRFWTLCSTFPSNHVYCWFLKKCSR